ncbi:MAG TPA: DUF6191 domain-containing protein [Jatrophihabitans sp.]|jgi:hypothetical protein|uniref:DUF6191 domain-containing protein n=1 Tax=Jatrophihabitans sp. TaxID=1932789 RepID=UPI002DFF4767|nr:DUF6191 domain-containing protein [Jatrophihabitans sp.]
MTQWGLDTLFNPAKRHMDEEKRRLQSTREEVGDNSGGKRIDFESGKVSIKRAAGEDADEATTDEATSDEATSDDAQAAKPEPKPAKKEQSAAAIRAAERRKRKSG